MHASFVQDQAKAVCPSEEADLFTEMLYEVPPELESPGVLVKDE
jgi:hypothetical protein